MNLRRIGPIDLNDLRENLPNKVEVHQAPDQAAFNVLVDGVVQFQLSYLLCSTRTTEEIANIIREKLA